MAGDDARFEGWSHQDIYDAVQKGPASAASNGVRDHIKLAASTLDDIEHSLGKGMEMLGLAVRSPSGDMAQDKVGALKSWTGDVRGGRRGGHREVAAPPCVIP